MLTPGVNVKSLTIKPKDIIVNIGETVEIALQVTFQWRSSCPLSSLPFLLLLLLLLLLILHSCPLTKPQLQL